jgi:hypothetical protein
LAVFRQPIGDGDRGVEADGSELGVGLGVSGFWVGVGVTSFEVGLGVTGFWVGVGVTRLWAGWAWGVQVGATGQGLPAGTLWR